MSAPKPAKSTRPISFDAFLDRRLADAQVMHGVMTKLWRIYHLNCEVLRLSHETGIEEDFDKLTVLAPPVNRADPLGILRGLDAEGADAHPDADPSIPPDVPP